MILLFFFPSARKGCRLENTDAIFETFIVSTLETDGKCADKVSVFLYTYVIGIKSRVRFSSLSKYWVILFQNNIIVHLER